MLAVLHSDTTLMPKRKQAWASWNYLGRSKEAHKSDLCVTYWMNRLQNLSQTRPIFVTLNPPRAPREELVHGVYNYAHPMFDTAALRSDSNISGICKARTAHGSAALISARASMKMRCRRVSPRPKTQAA